MRTNHCRFKIVNNEIIISHKPTDISLNELKLIQKIIYNEYNNLEWVDCNNIPSSYMYSNILDKYYYIKLCSFDEYIDVMAVAITFNINPFLLFNSIKLDDNNAIIKEEKITLNEVNYYYNEIYEPIIKALLQCIIDNFDNDKKIFIKANKNEVLFIFKLIGFLLPDKYNKISFSFGNICKLCFINDYNSSYEGILFDFVLNDYSVDIQPKRYSYTIVEKLNDSIDSCVEYKTSVNLMMNNHNLDISLAVDVINLIKGKIEVFSKVDSLSNAIKALDNIDHNSRYISSIIYPNLHKYEINDFILVVYKLIYENIESARNDIIELFFNNLSNFDIKNNLSYLEYLKRIEEKCPFAIVDYLYYLKEKKLFDNMINQGLSNLNEGYLLLDLICKDIKLNNRAIVPNQDLLVYISYAVDNKNINYLDIVLDRINKLNSKASSRLMSLKIIAIDKSTPNFILDIGLNYSFLLFERVEPLDAVRFYLKAYNSVLDRRVFIKEYTERERINKSYYDDLFLAMRSEPDLSDFLERKRMAEIYSANSVDKSELNNIYKEYYLNKYKNDNGLLLSKVVLYIDSLLPKEKPKAAIEIFNEFYRSLDYTYKDVFDSVRKLNDIIYKEPAYVIKNDSEYYNSLKEMNELLSKKKAIPNPYFSFIEYGLIIKYGYIKHEYKFIDDLLLKPQFINYDDDMIKYFMMYYLKYLFICFIEYVSEIEVFNKDNLSFIKGYNNIFNVFVDRYGFSNVIIDAFIELDYPQDIVFYYLIIASNSENNRNIKLIYKIFDEIGKKRVKIYLREYVKAIKILPWLNDTQVNNSLKCIYDYIDSNLGLIEKLIWKARCK